MSSLIGSVPTGQESVETGGQYKPPKSMLEVYVERLGILQAGLHKLELWLRVYLLDAEAPQSNTDLKTLKAGQKVPVSAFTDFASLRELVGRFNAKVDPGGAIEMKVVDLRNSLAHARIFSDTSHPPFKLMRFGKPNGDLVEVIDVVDLDASWFDAQTRLVHDESSKVFRLLMRR